MLCFVLCFVLIPGRRLLRTRQKGAKLLYCIASTDHLASHVTHPFSSLLPQAAF